MKIGYVCTNYNNSSFTRGAIASLKNGPRGTDVRVVVVDNQSRPEDVAQLRALAAEFADVELVLNPDNAGYFPGLNIGIRRMRERWPDAGILAVGNNDLVFPPDFVDTVERHRDVLDTWAVVAPDLVTLDGTHQNPHVRHPIRRMRKLIWDLYYHSYGAAMIIKLGARITKRLTIRDENAPDSQLYRTPGPIEQGYGACYLLGPVFFRHFSRLYAPTFMLQEEFFLYEQLKGIGQMTYYDPRFVVRHVGRATMGRLPSRRHWTIARDAHRVYKGYLKLSAQQRSLVAAGMKQSATTVSTRAYQVCTNCVMDTSDPGITFDDRGVCDQCNSFHKRVLPHWHPDERGWQELQKIVARIRKAGQGKDFDCIIGISGGADSSYLTYLAKVKLGLRPLVFHVDAGWNSQEAVNNIEQLIDRLGLDLYTEVIDWEEMRDLQLAFIKSGVPHIDLPQDHAFFATMYNFAQKYGVKYILTGGNNSTECIRNPLEWFYYGTDLVQIRDIHGRFGRRPLKNFPLSGVLRHKVYMRYIRGIRVVKPLDYVPYIKEEAVQFLVNNYGWQRYPQKHFESRFTKFFEGYWLPTKFGFDTRRVQFSSLIVTGQMTRQEALGRLAEPSYDKATIAQDFEYVAAKLGIGVEELQSYLDAPNKSYRDYKSQLRLFLLGAKVMHWFGLDRRVVKR